MGIFKRRPRAEQDEALAPEAEERDLRADDDEPGDALGSDRSEDGTEDTVGAATGSGTAEVAHRERPRDRAEVDDDEAEEYIRLGGVWVRGIDGMQLQLEVDEAQDMITAINVMLGASALQVQAFAAPRSGGLWREIREEIAEGVDKGRGTTEIVRGPFGDELHARLPQGRGEAVPVRFIGVDGPRWFVRGVVSGAAAHDDAECAVLYDVFQDLVITRGVDAMAPRELLPLTVPEQSATEGMHLQEQDDAQREGAPRADDLNPFERGPEITEVR